MMTSIYDELSDTLKLIEEIVNLKYHVIVETELEKILQLDSESLSNWCKENCTEKWISNVYIFSFELESEAMAFKLTWV